MKLVTAAQSQALDRRTTREAGIPSLTLMERAGAGTVAEIHAAFGPVKRKRVAVVCGKGHNGGDGLVIARHLKQAGANVQVWLLHQPAALAPDARTMLTRFRRAGGARLIGRTAASKAWTASLSQTDLIVDALLGTGVSASVTGPYAEAIEGMNASGRPIVAVDLPSGLHADTGARLGQAVHATLTVTFGHPKLGLFLHDGIDCAGSVRVVDIGIPADYSESVDATASLLTAATIRRLIPPRRRASHKGTYGHAGLIAGSRGKTGAAALAARGALRIGAGLVTVATPAGTNATLESKLLEAMTLPVPDTDTAGLALSSLQPLLAFAEERTAVGIGPGLGQHPETVQTIQTFLRAVRVPCVVDADGLNAATQGSSLWSDCRAPLILTPHPGEMARLCGLEQGRAVNEDRLGIARRFATTHGVVVVLKGARTVLAHPDGRLAINPTGNPGMATGGTGDVLTGMIVGLLAQGCSPWDATCAATYIHGLAGDLASQKHGEIGLIAGDLIEQIPYALQTLRS